MTMLDDDRLTALLTDAAATFALPTTGPEDILARVDDGPAGGGDGDARAADRGTPEGRMRRVAALAARHRVLALAAGLLALIVLAGAVAALTSGPAHPTRTSALSRPTVGARAHPPAPITTTTTPQFSTSGEGNQSSAGTGSVSGPTVHGTAGNAPDTTTPTTAPPLPSGAVGQSAKIEQTGSLALTVPRGKLSATVNELTALAGAYGGFVANSQAQTGAASGGASGSVTLQVPVQSFATVVTRAKALGAVSDLTTKATDVTGQYVDLQARITALQDSRQQYLDILAKATTVGDILSVQEQINGIQSQIEQLQGQLQLLTSQTTYSTLTVTVNEHTPRPAPPLRPLPESGLVRAWHASIGGFVTGVEGLIRFAGPLLFVLLLLGVILAGGRAVWRRYQRHNL
jgi:Domain of unknown function (DUF4349)